MATPKWPRDHEEKHRAAAKLGWARKKKRGGGNRDETVVGNYRKQAKGMKKRQRRELLHAFAEDYAYYQDRGHKRAAAGRLYSSGKRAAARKHKAASRTIYARARRRRTA